MFGFWSAGVSITEERDVFGLVRMKEYCFSITICEPNEQVTKLLHYVPGSDSVVVMEPTRVELELSQKKLEHAVTNRRKNNVFVSKTEFRMLYSVTSLR